METKITPNKETADSLADNLNMFASQIRESLKNESELPHPWVFDDWLNDYRTYWHSKMPTKRS